MEPNLSIVIMAYNEEDNLPVQLERTVTFLTSHGDQWQVIVVNDGSTDRTGDIAEAWSARYPERLTVIHHPTNRGMGAALSLIHI